MRIPSAVLGLLVAAAIAGCGSTVGRARADGDVITREQMLQNNFHNAYEAVQALHGNWLIVRANTFGVSAGQGDVVVYRDGVRLGSPTDLSGIDVRTIEFIRHYDASAATQRYGVGHSQGAILVSSFRP